MFLKNILNSPLLTATKMEREKLLLVSNVEATNYLLNRLDANPFVFQPRSLLEICVATSEIFAPIGEM